MANAGLIEKRSDRRWAVWHLADQEITPLDQPRLDFTGPTVSTVRRDRREQIRTLLSNGPLSARDLAADIGVSKEAVLRWLRRMELAGEVNTTGAARNSRLNKWELKK